MSGRDDVLSRRALGRATLARQSLLSRGPRAAEAALEDLVGLQGQAPDAPYVGLWSRLDGFTADDLAGLLVRRAAVRMPLMRATVHLVTARDALRLRPLVQPALERAFRGSPFWAQLDGADLGQVVTRSRALLEEQPRTRAALAPLLAEEWPHHDPTALSYAVTYLAPLVQVTPRGVWGLKGSAAWTTLERWLGEPLADDQSPEDLVHRYLAAFGPASVGDAQAWSGLTRLGGVFERLRAGLRTFRDEDGAELFDLPDAPLPDPDTPAPPRFLPEYDNVLFGHADRSRVLPPGRLPPLPPGNGASTGTILLDGMLAGTWQLTRGEESTIVTITPYRALDPAEEAGLSAEGLALLGFLDPDAEEHEVRVLTEAPDDR